MIFGTQQECLVANSLYLSNSCLSVMQNKETPRIERAPLSFSYDNQQRLINDSRNNCYRQAVHINTMCRYARLADTVSEN